MNGHDHRTIEAHLAGANHCARRSSAPARPRPGSVLEWVEEDGTMVVRRVGQFSSEDIHTALFSGEPPRARSLEELKESVGRHFKAKHARR